jgi:hypothetical protein
MANATVGQPAIRQAAEARRGSRVSENITDTADGVYERMLGAEIYFIAQAVNLHVNHVRRRINAHAPYLLQNHSARYYAAGIAAKIFEQRELLGRELQQHFAPAGLASNQIEF